METVIFCLTGLQLLLVYEQGDLATVFPLRKIRRYHRYQAESQEKTSIFSSKFLHRIFSVLLFALW